MLDEKSQPVNHPAHWLAEATAKKYPHLADVARRGAEIVTSGRITLTPEKHACTRATIANPTGQPYTIEKAETVDYERWDFDTRLRKNVSRTKTITKCNCQSYRRKQYFYKGEPYCKHIWAEQAARTITALCDAFTVIVQAMTPPDPADCYWYDGLDFDTGVSGPVAQPLVTPASDPLTVPAPGRSNQARTGNYLATRARIYRETEESRRAMPRQAQATGPHF